MPIRRDNRMTASKSPGIGEAAARPNPIEAVDPGGRRRITWGYSRRICSSLEAEDLEMRAKREPASRLSEFRSPYPGQIPNSVTPLTQFSLSPCPRARRWEEGGETVGYLYAWRGSNLPDLKLKLNWPFFRNLFSFSCWRIIYFMENIINISFGGCFR